MAIGRKFVITTPIFYGKPIKIAHGDCFSSSNTIFNQNLYTQVDSSDSSQTIIVNNKY
jgi:hypothetical protein